MMIMMMMMMMMIATATQDSIQYFWLTACPFVGMAYE
jgi:hypothetical protein